MGGLFESLSGAKALRVQGKSAQNIAEYKAAVAEQAAKAQEIETTFNLMQQNKEGYL